MTTHRTLHPTRKPAGRCTCTPTMRQANVAVIDCPRHGLAVFCRKLLVKG
jgi:hypothetical protein